MGNTNPIITITKRPDTINPTIKETLAFSINVAEAKSIIITETAKKIVHIISFKLVFLIRFNLSNLTPRCLHEWH